MRPPQLPISATGRLLLEDHERMDTLIEQVRNEIHSGDWRVCQATWSQFERQLVDHLATEEKFLLPVFEREYPDEAAGLREDHANFRRLLGDIGLRLELHNLREPHVRAFLDVLQAHAAREELLLYRCAPDLPAEVAEALAHRLVLAKEPKSA